jgi:hypothetical protein
MQQNVDPRKRPLLSAEQLRTLRNASWSTRKRTPRQEFERLFKNTPSASELQR